MSINIRSITPADAEKCSEIIYKAFCGIADKHNFPHDFDSAEQAQGFAQMLVNHPAIYGVAAEKDGEFVGSNFLWEHDEIAGVGPITVKTDGQAKGVGRLLMQAIIERGKRAKGIRLVQDAFNTASMSLYMALGFDVKEPLVLMTGEISEETPENVEVRRLTEADYAACDKLHREIHGVSRLEDLKGVAQMMPAFVVARDGETVGYASAPNVWQMNHAVAKTNEDLFALLAGASKLTAQPVSFLLPSRNGDLFRRLLRSNLKVVKPMTLMAMGEYHEPRAAFLPSVTY